MRSFFIILRIAQIVLSSVAIAPKEVIYGKYFSIVHENGKEKKLFDDNAYYLYNPPRNLFSDQSNPYAYTNPDKNFSALAATVVHFYGCGWRNCGGPWKKPGPIIGDLLRNGIAVVSVGYRRITSTYWYDDPTAEDERSPEELIHVDADGKLRLDTEGRTMKDYEVRICRHEFITKSLYDGARAIESLVAKSFEHGLDLNRLIFWAYSAGGSLAQYLTHIHHQWNEGAYTPLGMFYRSSMLDLPTANIMDRVWRVISRDTKDGDRTPLKDLIDKSDCWWVVANGCDDPRFNKYLQKGMPYKICNSSWNNATLDRYCGDAFDKVTVGNLRNTQRWLKDDPEVGEGMQRLWYASTNIRKHTPKPFYVLLYNLKREDYGLLHSSLYIPSFKRVFSEAHIYYTAYYDDHPQMKDFDDPMADNVADVVMGDGHHLKYQSNHGWRAMLGDAGAPARGDTSEFISYVCFVLSQPGCSPQLVKNATSRRMLSDVII